MDSGALETAQIICAIGSTRQFNFALNSRGILGKINASMELETFPVFNPLPQGYEDLTPFCTGKPDCGLGE